MNGFDAEYRGTDLLGRVCRCLFTTGRAEMDSPMTMSDVRSEGAARPATEGPEVDLAEAEGEETTSPFWGTKIVVYIKTTSSFSRCQKSQCGNTERNSLPRSLTPTPRRAVSGSDDEAVRPRLKVSLCRHVEGGSQTYKSTS